MAPREHPVLLRIGNLAKRLSAANDEHTAGYHERQLRHWVQLGIMEPNDYRGEGRVATALFSPSAVLKAQLLWAMTRLGLTHEHMRTAVRCMRNQRPAPKGGAIYSPGLLYALERIKAGERWFFVIHIPRSGDVMGGFTNAPEFGNPLIEGLTFAHLVFDCQELWRGLLDDLDETIPERSDNP